jgi:hypothetical protein
MPWFKVDDGLHSSRKVLSIPRSMRLQAVGLWTLAGSWCAKELTDGHFPDYMVEEWGGSPELVEALVKSGLWESQSQGFDFHNWGEYQPTKEEVEGARTAEAERKRKWRESRKSGRTDAPVPPDATDMSHGTRRDGPMGQDGRVRQASGHPDPTRPDPTRPSTTSDEVVDLAPAKSNRRKAETPLADGWGPANSAYEYCELHNLDIRHEESQFRNHAAANDRRQRDWDAAFRTWLGNAKKYQAAKSATSKPSAFHRNLDTVAWYAEQEQQTGKEIEA